MDRATLVAMITERVVEELVRSAAGGGGATAPSPPPREPGRPSGRRALLCGAPGSASEAAAWDALRSVEGVRWVAVDWPGYPVARLERGLGRVPDQVVPAPEVWDDLVGSVEAVVVPFGPLDLLARTALLLADCPPVAAAVAAVVQGVPVFMGRDDSERLTRHSARIPGGLLAVVQQHVRAVQSLGVRLEAPARIAAELSGGRVRSVASASSGRDVVTNEDVMAAVAAGLKVLEVTRGSIVTSLAHETASRNGIEVRFR